MQSVNAGLLVHAELRVNTTVQKKKGHDQALTVNNEFLFRRSGIYALGKKNKMNKKI